MRRLNPQQVLAVNTTDKPTLIIAGAGSGKTSVIVEKVYNLINQGLAANSIYALTFTNKAAKEMKERLLKRLNKNRVQLRIMTFHSFGLRVLKQEIHHLGYKNNFSIIDSADSSSLIKSLLVENFGVGVDDKDLAESIKHKIGMWKSRLLKSQDVLNEAQTETDEQAARIYEKYQEYLKSCHLVDFEDLIFFTINLFKSDADILYRWQAKIKHVLIDEYQDTNDSQYELFKTLVGNKIKFTTVGDDDQSIYSWRGANVQNLEQIGKDFPDLEVIKLEQNYRSTNVILSVANSLIEKNTTLYKKKLWSEVLGDNKVRVIAYDDEFSEANRVVTEISVHKYINNNEFSDYAVLYRSNYQSKLFEKVLREHNIPYNLTGGLSFFDRVEVKDLLAYLRLISNFNDDRAFLRIINVPKRGIGSSTINKIAEVANKMGLPLSYIITSDAAYKELDTQTTKKLNDFTHMLRVWKSKVDSVRGHDVIQFIYDIIDDIGYYDYFRVTEKNEAVVNKKIERVNELIAWIKSLIERKLKANAEVSELAGSDDFMSVEESTIDLGSLLQQIALLDILEGKEEVQDVVSLMTFHAAKGLEFKNVFMVGCEEEILPHKNSLEVADKDEQLKAVEEERRLAYVGITRAKENLTLTYVKERNRFGEKIETTPSRFIDELDDKYLSFYGIDNKPDAEIQEGDGLASFQKLREKLSEKNEASKEVKAKKTVKSTNPSDEDDLTF